MGGEVLANSARPHTQARPAVAAGGRGRRGTPHTTRQPNREHHVELQQAICAVQASSVMQGNTERINPAVYNYPEDGNLNFSRI
jgi:hypothetical protein